MAHAAAIDGSASYADQHLRLPLRAAAILLCGTLCAIGTAALLFDAPTAVAALLAGWFGWRGCRRGVMISAASLAGLIAVVAWAVPAGKWIAPGVGALSGLAAVPNRYLAVLVATMLLFMSGRVLGHFMTRRYGAGRHPLAGMWVGMVSGTVAGLLCATAVAAVEPPVRMALGLGYERQSWVPRAYDRVAVVRDELDASLVGRWASGFFADRDEVLRLGATLAVVAQYDGALTRLKHAPLVDRLLHDNPTIQRIVDEMTVDAALYAGLRDGRVDAILDSPTVLRLLDDTQLAETLRVHQERLFTEAVLAVPARARVAAQRKMALLQGHSPIVPQVMIGAHVGQAEPRMGEPVGHLLDGRGRAPLTRSVQSKLDRVVRPICPQ